MTAGTFTAPVHTESASAVFVASILSWPADRLSSSGYPTNSPSALFTRQMARTNIDPDRWPSRQGNDDARQGSNSGKPTAGAREDAASAGTSFGRTGTVFASRSVNPKTNHEKREKRATAIVAFCDPVLQAGGPPFLNLHSCSHNSRRLHANNTTRPFFRILPQSLRVPHPSPLLRRVGVFDLGVGTFMEATPEFPAQLPAALPCKDAPAP